MEYGFLDSFALREQCSLERDEPMSRHTTFRIGGPADRMIHVSSPKQLTGLIRELKEHGVPWMVLGNGSNLLVSDRGYRGVAVVLEGEFRRVTPDADGVTVTAGAGASLSSVCAFARDRGLSGLEFAWGIPGTVGGAVFMNAGAYGGEIRDVLETAAGSDGREVSGRDGRFGYRRSPFTDGDSVICSARFRLTPGDPSAIAGKMEELMARRKEKQPYDMPSAGSVFKRPVGGYAAALIEECGLKGLSVGGAQVSPKHSGFIVNTGGAGCSDVLELIRQIRETVLREKGIALETEVRVIGEQSL